MERTDEIPFNFACCCCCWEAKRNLFNFGLDSIHNLSIDWIFAFRNNKNFTPERILRCINAPVTQNSRCDPPSPNKTNLESNKQRKSSTIQFLKHYIEKDDPPSPPPPSLAPPPFSHKNNKTNNNNNTKTSFKTLSKFSSFHISTLIAILSSLTTPIPQQPARWWTTPPRSPSSIPRPNKSHPPPPSSSPWQWWRRRSTTSHHDHIHNNIKINNISNKNNTIAIYYHYIIQSKRCNNSNFNQ